ncbi:MAG: hypothetical protein ACOCYU_01755 [Brevefilum sp.]
MFRRVLSRLGCLLSTIGIILLVLGISAESSGQSAFNFLLLGILLLISGFLLWRKLRPKPRRSTRFSMFRKRERDGRPEEDQDDRGWGDKPYD